MLTEIEYNTIWSTLNDKHKLFINTYIANDKYANKAYAIAYNKDKMDNTVESAASRLLSNVKIKSCIDYKMHKINTKLEITAEYLQQKLKDIIDSVKEKTHNRISAMSLMAKMKDYIIEKREITVKERKSSADELLNEYDKIIKREEITN